jgi:hypothetical protein
MQDWRMNYFVSDKWQATRNADHDAWTPLRLSGRSPAHEKRVRAAVGLAYSPTEKTLIRGGAGKFYQYQATRFWAICLPGRVNSPTFTF